MAMRFGIPMVWQKPKNHHGNCHFCMADMSGWNQHKKSWHYPNIDSAIRLVAHCKEVPIPVFISLPDLLPDELDLKTAENEDRDSNCSSCRNYSDTSLAAERHSQENKPKPFTQGQLNDLVHDLGLSKEASEILASRLEHNILDSQTKITFYRDTDEVLIQYLPKKKIFL